jgi:hypothetical protein
MSLTQWRARRADKGRRADKAVTHGSTQATHGGTEAPQVDAHGAHPGVALWRESLMTGGKATGLID